jgi:hypothetical protein
MPSWLTCDGDTFNAAASASMKTRLFTQNIHGSMAPGAHSFPMDKKIRAVAAARLLQDLKPLR